MLYYYTYTITCGTITRVGAGVHNKIFKYINEGELAEIKIVGCYDNFNDAMKHAVSMGLQLLPTSAVVCNETGEYFVNAVEAAKSVNAARANMSKHLNHIGSWKTLGGKTFRYLEDNDG